MAKVDRYEYILQNDSVISQLTIKYYPNFIEKFFGKNGRKITWVKVYDRWMNKDNNKFASSNQEYQIYKIIDAISQFRNHF